MSRLSAVMLAAVLAALVWSIASIIAEERERRRTLTGPLRRALAILEQLHDDQRPR